MKPCLIISAIVHAGILWWGMFSLQNVRTFEAVQAEALPVDFIPVESITRLIKGDTRANRTEKPSPRPARNPPDKKSAKNAGNTELDAKSSSENLKKAMNVKAEMPSFLKDKPKMKPVKTELRSREKIRESAVAKTRVASLNEPAVPVTEIKTKEKPAKAEESDSFKLPDKTPLPISRPKPQQSKTARTMQRKSDRKTGQRQEWSTREEEKRIEDKIAALLNRQEPVAAGARRSTSPAALGVENLNRDKNLSRSEMDALRSAIQQCWNVPVGLAGAENMRVTVTMNLAKDGNVQGQVGVDARGGENVITRRAFAESARRAVLKCSPYNLPLDKYDVWSEVIVNFDPGQMF